MRRSHAVDAPVLTLTSVTDSTLATELPRRSAVAVLSKSKLNMATVRVPATLRGYQRQQAPQTLEPAVFAIALGYNGTTILNMPDGQILRDGRAYCVATTIAMGGSNHVHCASHTK